MAEPDKSSRPPLEAPRPLTDSLAFGVLQKHGRAPYLNDPQGAPSYFVTVETARGERTFWGRELEKAFRKSQTRPQIGQEVGVRENSIERAAVTVRTRDEHSREVDVEHFDSPRPRWVVEKRAFFNERAAMAKALRDPNVPRGQAVRDHPELEAAYVIMDGAQKIAAASMVRPEMTRSLMAFVRETLAYTIERGESVKVTKSAAPPAREPASDLEQTR